MGQSNDRLRQARELAGFKTMEAAAKRFLWKVSTYRSHENGQTPVPVKAAQKYALAFKVSAAWIVYGGKTVVDVNKLIEDKPPAEQRRIFRTIETMIADE